MKLKKATDARKEADKAMVIKKRMTAEKIENFVETEIQRAISTGKCNTVISYQFELSVVPDEDKKKITDDIKQQLENLGYEVGCSPNYISISW